MNNKHLYIRVDGTIFYCDNALSGIARVESKEDIIKFCNERADEWRTSNLGNFTQFTQEEREKMANLWENAKQLPEGEYDYYFNIEDKVESFKTHVKELAKKLGIDYELIIKE